MLTANLTTGETILDSKRDSQFNSQFQGCGHLEMLKFKVNVVHTAFTTYIEEQTKLDFLLQKLPAD